MKCPRDGCKNEAGYSRKLGVLPCEECLAKDRQVKVTPPPEFATQSQTDRVRHEREIHKKDIIQPFTTGMRVNPEFAKAYPDRVDDYFTKEQLKTL